MAHNPLVEFLAAYGPTSDGNNMYDEFVMGAAKKAGLDPLSIPETISDEIVSALRGPYPCSYILTGTAGDGKTYTARKVLEKLSQRPLHWPDGQAELKYELPENGRSICFIKDLSEVQAKEKATIIPRLIKAFSNPGTSECFVLCVNDGHLLRTWEEHMGQSDPGAEILATFRELLRDDRETPPSGMAFRLKNMSRTSHARLVDAIIEQVCEHPGWKGCDSACDDQTAATCPILINRHLLLRKESASLRSRLQALIEIAAADDKHLSIRQLIILVVNALLGDSKDPYRTPLMNCARAQLRTAENGYCYTSPYDNIFGDNHSTSRRSQHAAFAVLAEFGIGLETNNYFDGLLLDAIEHGMPVDHPQYGLASYEQTLKNYQENPGGHIDALRQSLKSQRRRLFFEWPDDLVENREENPWQLTIHSFGDLYLNLLKSEDERESNKYRRAREGIIKGLNRVLTGSWTETRDRLWLTQPSGVYKGVEIPILVTPPIGWKGIPYQLELQPPAHPGRPPCLQLVTTFQDPKILASLLLTPTLFEYLMRVNDGALPMSFSNQCFQDIRNFQIRCVGGINDFSDPGVMDMKAVDSSEETLMERGIGSLESDV